MTLSNGSPGEELVIDRTVSMVEDETVSTPAGRFEATRVDYVDRARLGELAAEYEESTWLVEGLGMVRSITTTRSELMFLVELEETERVQ